MKKILGVAIGVAFLLPTVVLASGIVDIDTTINNVNGGTLDFNGLNSTALVTPTGAYSMMGTPQFFIPAGSFKVLFSPPAGYVETHDNNCSGTVADGQTIHCHVTYRHGEGQSQDVNPQTPTYGIFGTIPVSNVQMGDSQIINTDTASTESTSTPTVQTSPTATEPTTETTVATSTPQVQTPQASTHKLTAVQVSAIIGLLRAFGINETTIAKVQSFL